MREQALFVVDAFAEAPFTGNPAAVCLLDGETDAGWQQRVAAEMNLSETAFLVPRGRGEWGLRWFTPSVEVDLCGHATLASAHVLWQAQSEDARVLTFHTRSGALTATREDDAVRLDLPAGPTVAAEDDQALYATVRDCLSAAPEWLGRAGDTLIAVLDDVQRVTELSPDMARLAALDVHGVAVTAASNAPEYDFVSRFFAPRVGIPEDPVTGSIHCVLGPYWGERLGTDALRAYQASPRGGALGIRLRGDRVHLLGHAVTVLEGVLRV